MNAFEKRALRFQNNNSKEANYDRELIQAALANVENNNNNSDKGRRDDDCAFKPFIPDSETNDVQQLLAEKAEFLKVLGTTPGSKGEGVSRVLLENLNSLKATLHSNPKLDKLKQVLDDLEVDVFGFNEHRNNLKHKDCRRHGITQLFDGGESLVKGLWCSNDQEKLDKFISTRTREGGTGMLAFGEMASLISTNGFGRDETGLARWTYLEVTGKEGITTVFLVGYCPCKNFVINNGTSYQQ